MIFEKFKQANEMDKIKLTTASNNDDLVMFNYMYALSDWSDKVVRQARGIVFDKNTGETVVKSFDKFFNYNQNKWMVEEENKDDDSLAKLSSIETKEGRKIVAELSNWPKDFKKLRVYDKLDGSIMNVSVYKDNLICSSSGSIDGIYPKYFQKSLKSKLGDRLDEFKETIKGKTLTFEFINPIIDPHIVKYDENDLVLLGMHDNKTYFDYEFTDEINEIAELFNFTQPKIYQKINDLDDLKVLLEQLDKKENIVEGVVVAFLLEDGTIKRLKFKLPTYLKLHRKVEAILFTPYTKTNASEIYNMFENDTIDDLLADFNPPENHLKLITYYKSLFEKHHHVLNQVIDYLNEKEIQPDHLKQNEIRKSVVKKIGSEYGNLGIMIINQFSNGEDISKIKFSENPHFEIWFNKMIKTTLKEVKEDFFKVNG